MKLYHRWSFEMAESYQTFENCLKVLNVTYEV